MTEQLEVIGDLSESGVLAGITWAVTSAYAETMRDFDPRRGYGPGWIGYTAHGLICDRMNRVFSCGDFHLPSGLPAEAGMDAVRDGLHADDFRTMPHLDPDLVSYSPLNNSPGWRHRSTRWLLQSYEFGQSQRIPWARKSATKRRVASHPNPDQPGLFTLGELTLDVEAGPALLSARDDEEADTFVLGHSIHKDLRERELYFGRPNLVSQQAWHWKHNLMTHRQDPGGGMPVGYDPQPYTPNPNAVVSDAPVRLRTTPKEHNSNETSG
ncbi:hypothetical protein [Streptomyces sp. NPDC056480]|uniref:hypothetical protein n=1 Tax=Streptomyces sp. NPDC056480 TaxID=3345833 RepID=UPI0036B3DB32